MPAVARVVRRCLHALTARTPDADLLRLYSRDRDADAFAELVARHGPVVLGVCRRALGHTADAEDAFQATFLALARNARSVRDASRLPGWLHRVALRAARRARARRKPALPLEAATDQPAPPESCDLSWREGLAVLDEELNALPDRLRSPLVLCYLDGLTRDEAASRLGLSLAMLKRRLEEGRSRLRERLVRRGVSAAVLAAAAGTGEGLRAGVSVDLFTRATRPSPHSPESIQALARGLVTRPVPRPAPVLFGILVLAGLSAVATLFPTQARRPPAASGAAVPPASAEAPLPPGAVARLGSSRFRHADGINSSALSPDGKLLASTGVHTIAVWDTETGERKHLLHPPALRGGWHPQQVAFSPDGALLAGVAVDQAAHARIWDVRSGKELAVVARDKPQRLPGQGEVDVLCFDRAGRELVLCGARRILRCDPRTGKVVRELPALGRVLTASPQAGTFLALAHPAGSGRLGGPPRHVTWEIGDLATGKVVSRFDVTERVRELPPGVFKSFGESGPAAISPAGDRAAVILDDALYVWDAKSGKELTRFEVEGGLVALEFSPDGRQLFGGGSSGAVRRFLLSAAAEGKPLGRHPGLLTGIHFAGDAKRVLTTGQDGLVRRWDPGTGDEIAPPDGYVRGAALARSPDGRRFAVGDPAGRLDLYDAGGRPVTRLGRSGEGVRRVSFAPDGRRVAAVLDDGTARVWDAATGRETARTPFTETVPIPDAPLGLEFAPDGRRLLICRDRATVWDLATGTEALAGLPAASAAAISPDGSVIVSGDYGGRLTWTGANTGKEVRQVPIPRLGEGRAQPVTVARISFAPDGRTFLTAHFDGSVRVWDTGTGATTRTLPADGHICWWARYSPDGKWIASGPTSDGTIRIWEAATEASVHKLPGHGGWSLDGAWGPDARTLLTAGGADALLWSLRPADLGPPADPATAWGALAAEPAKAYRAQWALLDDPRAAVELLRDRQAPAKGRADERRVRQLIADLDSDRFRTRERAAKALGDLGRPVVPSLREGLKTAGSEGRKRLGELIDELTIQLTSHDLRQMRAVQVLELAGTSEAKALLAEWSRGQPGAVVTEQAAEALKRLDSRP